MSLISLEFVGRQQFATDAQADPGEHVADVPVAGTLIGRDVAQHHSFESLAILSRAVRDYRPNHFSPATPRYPGLDSGPLGRPTFPPPPGANPLWVSGRVRTWGLLSRACPRLLLSLAQTLPSEIRIRDRGRK